MATAGFTVPAQDAVHTTLAADAAFATFRGVAVDDDDPRLYDGAAPPGVDVVQIDGETPQPYVVYGEMSEDAITALCQTDGAAFEIPWDLRVWVAGADHRTARVGYGHLRRLLHDRTWSVTGGTLTATVALVRTQVDPDRRATQAITRVFLTARPS